MSVPPYEISIKCPPPNLIPLTEAYAKGHSIEARHAETEAEALTICGELIEGGYAVEVKGPNGLHWGREEVKRRVKAVKA
jgi:hypothetical protein